MVLADESTGTEAFADAREPLAQAFKAVGDRRRRRVRRHRQPLQVQGLRHRRPRRSGQRQRPPRASRPTSLVTFADEFKTLRGITRVFLAGDFNAYSEEDPIQVLNDAGLHQPRVDQRPRRGELQLRRPDRARSTTCSPTRRPWPTSTVSTSGRSTPTSRCTTSTAGTTTTSPTSTCDGPFKSSDHNPEIIGIDTPAVGAGDQEHPDPRHQRLPRSDRRTTPPSAAAGAAVLAGAVKQLRDANPDTVFVGRR